MRQVEIRTGKAAPVEFRKAEDGSGPGVLTGYAIVYNSLSRNLGGFVEQVSPEATKKSLADEVRVMARYNHDDNQLLGTTDGGSLELESDGTGLRYTVTLPDTQAGRDVAVLASRGDLRYSSFAFTVPPGGDEWSYTDKDFPLRTITAMQLIDVAPVNDPAYLDTTTALRSLGQFKTSAADAAETEVPVGQGATHLTADFIRAMAALHEMPFAAL